jgi:hypothetical protein
VAKKPVGTRRLMMKRKLLISILIVAVSGLFIGMAASHLSANQGPPGVDPKLWYPMTERLGLAVRVEPGLAGRMEYIGTVMVKEGEHWRPVYLEGPGLRVRPVQ